MKTAWVITWEWAGGHAAVKSPFVAVLNWRWSSNHVLTLVQQLYAQATLNVEEQIAVARNPKSNPHPASFVSISGARHEGRISCGGNPWLYGRLVSNVRFDHGTGAPMWDEPCIPAAVAGGA
jgi:hypothetical protein